MSLVDDQHQPTTLTQPHRQLLEALEGLGLSVTIEMSFPPYHVDCYLPDYHVAVEADGPSHSRRKDETRDDQLMVAYALPVYRVDSGILGRGSEAVWRALALEILGKTWRATLVERRLQALAAGGMTDEQW